MKPSPEVEAAIQVTLQPSDLGAPTQQGRFRPQQEALFQALISSDKPILCVNAPPGVGKSLLGWTYAKILAARGVIYTGTKGLQDQYERDWAASGVVDIRGMANYPCRALDPPARCDVGPCLDGESCLWKQAGCTFFDRVREAKAADLVTTNYAFHFSHPPGPEGYILGDRSLHIYDEAHDLPSQICKAVGAEFDSREVEIDAAMKDWQAEQWLGWAEVKREDAKALLASDLTPAQRKEVRDLYLRFCRVVHGLESAPTDWAWDWIEGRRSIQVNFEPISAAPYFKSYCLGQAERALLMSGTILPSVREELGLAPEEFEYFETESPFPLKRRPIQFIQCGVRVTNKSSEGQLREWVKAIDRYIGAGREERQGLIHAVSYKRAKFIQRHSKYVGLMILPESSDTAWEFRKFCQRRGPGIFLSPAAHTGYSFDDDAARWQIIAKVPFPDTTYGIAKARAERIQHYIQKHAARTMMQMAGRIVRSVSDWGETAVIDDTIEWVFSRYRPYFSSWFRRAVKTYAETPRAMEVPE